MKRRKLEAEPENHERWLVSYADFLTLLLAFFVVMYSISSVNQGKYKVFSDSLITAFKGGDGVKLAPVVEGTNTPDYASWWQIPVSPLPQPIPEDLKQRRQQQQALERLQRQLQERMSGLIGQGQVQIQREQDWLLIEMRSGLLFDLGSDTPSRAAGPVLDELSRELLPLSNFLRVRGYTDNLPITTPRFPSNWELSTARAATIVRMLRERGIAPQRMAAEGYAEFAPVADNSTLEGRARNRRVVLAISTSQYQETAGPLAASPVMPKAEPLNPPGTAVATPISVPVTPTEPLPAAPLPQLPTPAAPVAP